MSHSADAEQTFLGSVCVCEALLKSEEPDLEPDGNPDSLLCRGFESRELLEPTTCDCRPSPFVSRPPAERYADG